MVIINPSIIQHFVHCGSKCIAWYLVRRLLKHLVQ